MNPISGHNTDQESITDEKIQSRLSELMNLPTLPGIVTRLTKMAESQDAGAAEIADVISTDQVLSAKVLRLVNSPMYGFPGRISSVKHAVVLLGFNVVKGMVLGTAVFDAVGKEGQGLWEHSLGCAIISRRLAKESGLDDPDEVMIAGLLHDLGKVVLMYLYPDRYQGVLARAQKRNCHISNAEQDVLGIDHSRVGRWLVGEWHFPDRLADSMTYHHRPDRARRSPASTAMVHVADILARGMGYGHPGDMTMPGLDHNAFQSMRLSFDQIDHVLSSAEAEFQSSVDAYSIGE